LDLHPHATTALTRDQHAPLCAPELAWANLTPVPYAADRLNNLYSLVKRLQRRFHTTNQVDWFGRFL